MIIVLLLGMLFVSVLWEGYFRYWWSKEIAVRLWFETDAVYAGQETKLYEVIENTKAMLLITHTKVLKQEKYHQN